MLSGVEILFSYLSIMIIYIIGLGILKQLKMKKIPNGLISIQKQLIESDNFIPGSKFSHFGIITSTFLIKIFEIFLMVFIIFDVWDKFSNIFAFDLPRPLNWIGIGIYIAVFGWSLACFYYNVNFNKMYEKVPDSYALATGGPYSFCRHPMYFTVFFEYIAFILSTGIWLSTIGLILFIIAFPIQANGEEQLMLKKFGESYQNYMSKTNRFFPKIIKW